MSGTEPRSRHLWRTQTLVGGSAGLVLAAVTADVVGTGPLTRREQNMVPRLTGIATPWVFVTTLGDRPALAAATAAGSCAALIRGLPRSAVLGVVATVGVGTSVRWALSRVIDRERPAPHLWLMNVSGPSYPSRHATAAALAALVLYRSLPRSRLLGSVLTAGVVAVGISRVRLGVHWPSDILAGITLAALVDAVISSITGRSMQSATSAIQSGETQ